MFDQLTFTIQRLYGLSSAGVCIGKFTMVLYLSDPNTDELSIISVSRRGKWTNSGDYTFGIPLDGKVLLDIQIYPEKDTKLRCCYSIRCFKDCGYYRQIWNYSNEY